MPNYDYEPRGSRSSSHQGSRRPAAHSSRSSAGRDERRPDSRRPVSSAARKTSDPKRDISAARQQVYVQKNKKLNILISALSGVLVLSIVLAIFVPMQLRASVLAQTLPSSSASVAGDDYDMDANSLPVSELVGTILPETEDAGVEYLEETLFIGDSNTVRMMSYSDITHVTMDNGIGSEGMGIQSVASFKCVQFQGNASPVTIPQAVAIMQPRRIIITFGTNNAGGITTDSFVSTYRTALEAIVETYPYADIIIGAVPPVSKISSLSMTTIDEFNVALAQLAEEMGHKFLNWSEVLKDKSTGYAVDGYMLSTDGYHFSSEVMGPLADYIRTHSYITEDRRPTPLAAIPQHVGTISISSGASSGTGSASGNVSSSSSAISSSSASSSSSSAVSSSSSGTIRVDIGVYGGSGTVSGNGQSGGAISVESAPGNTLTTITATPADGYTFDYWSCSIGSIADTTNPTLSGFLVPSHATSVTIRAYFKPVAVSSSSEAPPPPVSSSETVSSSEPATSSEAITSIVGG